LSRGVALVRERARAKRRCAGLAVRRSPHKKTTHGRGRGPRGARAGRRPRRGAAGRGGRRGKARRCRRRREAAVAPRPRRARAPGRARPRCPAGWWWRALLFLGGVGGGARAAGSGRKIEKRVRSFTVYVRRGLTPLPSPPSRTPLPSNPPPSSTPTPSAHTHMCPLHPPLSPLSLSLPSPSHSHLGPCG
jgi:hypothetical protein